MFILSINIIVGNLGMLKIYKDIEKYIYVKVAHHMWLCIQHVFYGQPVFLKKIAPTGVCYIPVVLQAFLCTSQKEHSYIHHSSFLLKAENLRALKIKISRKIPVIYGYLHIYGYLQDYPCTSFYIYHICCAICQICFTFAIHKIKNI